MGNTLGIASLVKGMKVEDVIEKLKGIECGVRGTSCPDQLAKALEAYLEEDQDSKLMVYGGNMTFLINKERLVDEFVHLVSFGSELSIQ